MKASRIYSLFVAAAIVLQAPLGLAENVNFGLKEEGSKKVSWLNP